MGALSQGLIRADVRSRPAVWLVQPTAAHEDDADTSTLEKKKKPARCPEALN